MSSDRLGPLAPEDEGPEAPGLIDVEDDRDESVGKSPLSSPDFSGDFSEYVHYTCRKCGDPCLNREGSDAERVERCWKCFSPKRPLTGGQFR